MTSHTSSFPHLFTPLKVGRHTLPNRILMGSMHTGLEEQGNAGLARLAAFYAERARGGCSLMVTGGFSPNPEGRLGGEGGFLVDADADQHQQVTDAVHGEDSRIMLQLLHAGRYGYHGDIVAPSPIRSPINKHTPREMTEDDIQRTISEYARAAQIALAAGYDGVEIMGSEGYLINEFTAPCTNRRTDRWGGSFENRARFPVQVIKAVRAATDPQFIIMYRLSVLDIVQDGSPFEEVAALARLAEAAGADILNSGIGWHEARIPTIAQAVPRAGWTWATATPDGQGCHPADRQQPHQHAGNSRTGDCRSPRRHGVDGPALPGRWRLRGQGPARQASRNQHLHCLQPGVPRSLFQRQGRNLPGQSAGLP